MIAVSSGELDGKKILVADDQVHIVRLIQTHLEREGYRVTPAYDGEEALLKIRMDRPDLIICDMIMPRKDGFEVLRELKSHPETADIPFMVLTAKPADKSFRGFENGLPYLIKPFSPIELIVSVASVLESRPAGGEHS